MSPRPSNLWLGLLLGLLSSFLSAPPASGQGDLEAARRQAEEELRQALTGKKPKQKISPELRLAQLRWGAYQDRIERATAIQDKLVAEGGDALWAAVKRYEARAEPNGDAVDHYLAGRLFGLVSNLEKARQHFDQAISLDHYLYWGYHGLGTYYAMRKMWEPALSHYDEALKLNPHFLPSLRGKALCQAQSGNLEAAANTLALLLAGSPKDTTALDALAKIRMRQLRYEDAAKVLERLTKLQADNLKALLDLGKCCARTDQGDRALVIYQQVLKRDAESWEACLAVAQIWFQRGFNHKSADWLERCLKHLPVDAPLKRDEVEARVARLRTLPEKVHADPNRKSPQEWANVVVNSADVELRRKGARVLLQAPRPLRFINETFFNVIKKDRDPEMETLALSWIRLWWPAEELRDQNMMAVLKTLLRIRKDPRVVAQIAWLMQLGESPSAVPALIHALPGLTNEHALREVHRALNALTFAYLEPDLPFELTFEDIDRVKKEWAHWYAAHRKDYVRFEEKQ